MTGVALFFGAVALFVAMEMVLRGFEQRRAVWRMLGLTSTPLFERAAGRLERWPRVRSRLRRMALGLGFHVLPATLSPEGAVLLYLAGVSFLVLVLSVLSAWLLAWPDALAAIALGVCTAGALSAWLLHRGRERLLAELPSIYRLLSSRYMVCGDMDRALSELLPDLSAGAKRLFSSIAQASYLNDRARREQRLLDLTRTVDDEYFTLLVVLIRQAGDRGGQDVIAEQFITLGEECLEGRQLTRDLRMAARGYLVLLGVLGGLYLLVPRLNRALMLPGADAWYGTRVQLFHAMLFFCVLAAGATVLVYLSREV